VRFLVTGACGFIGSHLCDRLLAEGHHVVGLDNASTGRLANLAHLQGHPRFQFQHRDLLDMDGLEGDLDWIMHFASPASPPRYMALGLETLRVNAEGTWKLLEMARQKGARLFLASTSEVYGDPQVHPQPETYWGNVNPVGPRAVYDEAKRYAEALVVAYHRRHGLPVRIIRIFNTYGPRMDPQDGRVVTNFIRQALQRQPLTIQGDGTQTRSFQYISDLIDGIMALLEVDYPLPVNLGNPQERSVLELARLVQELAGTDCPLEFVPRAQDDPQRRCPDISLARRLLLWEPRVDLREGLLRTLEHCREELHAR
jgi:dTDP-glucose 4,6-dehydratase